MPFHCIMHAWNGKILEKNDFLVFWPILHHILGHQVRWYGGAMSKSPQMNFIELALLSACNKNITIMSFGLY